MYDKPENAVLSRRERVLLDPLGASEKSLKKHKDEAEDRRLTNERILKSNK